MIYNWFRESPLVAALLWRTILLAGLLMLLIHLLVSAHLYATALVVVGFIALIVTDINRVVMRADQVISRFLDALSASAIEDSQSTVALGRLALPFQRAIVALQANRSAQERRIEYLQSLLDTVQASLLVVREDRSIVLANRAAQRFARQPVDRLEDIDAIGVSAAAKLKILTPGSHQILRLESGLQVLASISQLTIPGQAAHKLISLQRLIGELDAVELKAWDDMAVVLSHEIMNSLTPIASLSESLDNLLRHGGHQDEVAAAIEAIRRRSLGLMNFVERYRKVTELPLPLMQMVNLRELLGSIEHLMAATYYNRRIAYASSIVPSDLFVHADPQLLEQALINLLGNAADAVAGVTEPRLQINCRLENGQVAIAVVDNGIGLSQEQKDHPFVPFYTTKIGGSGIGLNLVRRIALAHKGYLTVASNVPTGSIFTLTLNA